MDGFDCSGFVTFVLNQAGLTIPDYIGQDGENRPIRHANEYWDNYGIAVHEGLQQGGDLVFFSHNGLFPSHVGIMLDEGEYIHASGRDNPSVEVKPLIFRQIPVTDREQAIYSRSPIGFKSPTYALDDPSYRYHQQRI